MNPIKFKEVNVVYAESQDEYMDLPVLKYRTNQGECISCWKLSWRERFKILFTGEMWLCLLTFNKSLSPVMLTVHKSDLVAPEVAYDDEADHMEGRS